MKKALLTFAALMAAAGMYAQSGIQLYMEGAPLTPGSTYTYNNVTVDDFLGVVIDPGLYLLSSENKEGVSVLAENTTGQTIQMCCGGACQSGEFVEKNDLTVTANTQFPLQFEYINSNIFNKEEVPENITTNITVLWDEYEEIYTIVLNDNGNGVSVVRQDKDVYVDNNEIVYSLSENTAVTIYDSNGRAVMQTEVAGSGKLNLDNLAGGMYIYCFSGKNTISGKLIVK